MAHQLRPQATRPSAGYLVLALLLSLLAALPLLIGRGVVNTRAGGDSPFLLQRVHQLAQNLRSGVFPARWMPEGAHGLGYPFYNFYAAFPYYVAALLDIAGCGVLWGTKLAQALGFIASGLTSFVLARKITRSEGGALLASAVYTFAPFHLVNVYVRGDSLSEFYAFALYPLIIWAILKLRDRPSPERIVLLAASFGLLVLTHNISAMIFAPLAGLWLLAEAILSKGKRWRVLLAGCLGLGLGLALSAWFWLPMLRERSLVQLQEQTTGYFHYAGHFRTTDLLQWRPLHDYAIARGRDPFSTGLFQGFVAILGLVALALNARKRRGANASRLLAFLSLGVYTWLMTPSSGWVWEHVPLAAYVQFPWRLLSVQALSIALIAANIPALWPGRWGRGVGLILAGAAAVAGMAGLRPDRLPLREADITPQRLMLYETFSGNIGTTIRHEYLPREMVPRPFVSAVQLNRGEKPAPLALEGQLRAAQLVSRTPVSETWDLEVAGDSLLAFHTTFYPGWEAQVDGLPQPVEPLGGLGLVGLRLSPGGHRVRLRFEDTPLRRQAARISLASLAACLTLALCPCGRSRRYRVGTLATAGLLAIGAAWLVVAPSPLPRAEEAQGPLVMDYARAPYLHEEPDGVHLGEALLRGYTFDETRVRPGDTLHLSLAWQRTYPEHQAWIQLVGATAHLFEPSPVWAEASAAIMGRQLRLALDLPDDIPPGLYVLRLSVRKRGQEQVIRTFRGREMGPLALQPVQVVAGREASGREPVLAYFGPERAPPVIALVSMSFSKLAGERLVVGLTWRAERQAPVNYMLSVRLNRADGERVVARDLPPLLGGYPTSLWRPEELITDRVILTLPEDTPRPGEYQLEVVLYDRMSLQAAGTAAAKRITLR